MSNQGYRQQSARAIAGSVETYEGDFLKMFTAEGVPAGGVFNERFLLWLNSRLGRTYTNLPEAQTAFAISLGLSSWNDVGLITGGSIPSGPQQTIPEDDGLGGYEFEYESATGYFVIQIIGRNNANALPGVSVTWGGDPMEEPSFPLAQAVEGTPFTYMGVYQGGTGDTRTMTVTSTGSTGQALILVTDLTIVDVSWQGGEDANVQTDVSNITVPYGSVGGNPGQVFQSVCWLVPDMPSIEQVEASIELWMATAGDTTAAFYTIENTIAPALFEWDIGASGLSGPAGCHVVEVQGAVLA